jgi:hypothetical protein
LDKADQGLISFHLKLLGKGKKLHNCRYRKRTLAWYLPYSFPFEECALPRPKSKGIFANRNSLLKQVDKLGIRILNGYDDDKTFTPFIAELEVQEKAKSSKRQLSRDTNY